MIHRRDFLRSVAAAKLSPIAVSDLRAQTALPPPQESGIEHIVVVTMENRSFDHSLGWLPGADGRQAGLNYADANGVSHPTYPLAPDYTGCPHPDPDHSYTGARVDYDGGAMDGFLRAGTSDVYSIGYYTAADLPFFSAVTQNYLACDQYFASILGPTFPNRLFLWAAQTDRRIRSHDSSHNLRHAGGGGSEPPVFLQQSAVPRDVGIEVQRRLGCLRSSYSVPEPAPCRPFRL